MATMQYVVNANVPETITIRVKEIAVIELREQVFRKYGRLYGVFSEQAALALVERANKLKKGS